MELGYWKPKTVPEALHLASEHEGARFLAGGTELQRLGCPVAASGYIDLKDVGLDSIHVDANGIHVGAMVTFTQALESELVPQDLKVALRFMGSMPKRNMATIGGNVMRLGSDSYLAPTLAAAHAKLVFLTEQGKQTLSFGQLGPGCGSGFLLKEIVLDPKRRVVSRRFANTQESHAAVTVALGCGEGGSDWCAACALRGSSLQILEKSIKALGSRASFHASLEDELKAVTDLTGSAAYKRYLVEECLWDLAKEQG